MVERSRHEGLPKAWQPRNGMAVERSGDRTRAVHLLPASRDDLSHLFKDSVIVDKFLQLAGMFQYGGMSEQTGSHRRESYFSTATVPRRGGTRQWLFGKVYKRK